MPKEKFNYKGCCLVRGSADLTVIEGDIEVFGCRLGKKDSFHIPDGRQIPLYSREGATIHLESDSTLKYMITPINPIPRSWIRLVDKAKDSRKIVVIGDTDVGKSGLTLYLSNSLVNDGYKVGIVDSDIGQSDIGPPTTIGLSIIDVPQPTYWDLPLTEVYFIGDKSPVGHLLPMVVGTQKLVSKAFDLNADIVVVNTTGLVYGGPAIALKRFKVEAIEPNLIIFLERNGELRQLRQLFSKRYELYNAEVPTTIKSKSREERISFRNISLARYFKKPVRLEVEMNKVRVVNLIITRIPNEDEYINMIKALEGPKPLYIVGNHHTAVAVYEKSIPRDYLFKVRRLLSRYFSDVRITTIQRYKGLISAIFGTKGFLGLARVEELDLYSNKIILSTDIRDKSLVKEVHLGYIVLDENYNEKSTLKPGHGLL